MKDFLFFLLFFGFDLWGGGHGPLLGAERQVNSRRYDEMQDFSMIPHHLVQGDRRLMGNWVYWEQKVLHGEN